MQQKQCFPAPYTDAWFIKECVKAYFKVCLAKQAVRCNMQKTGPALSDVDLARSVERHKDVRNTKSELWHAAQLLQDFGLDSCAVLTDVLVGKNFDNVDPLIYRMPDYF